MEKHSRDDRDDMFEDPALAEIFKPVDDDFFLRVDDIPPPTEELEWTPKPTQRYEPKPAQGYGQRYEPKPTQRYEPKSEQGYEHRYEPKPTQRYEPKPAQGYEQRYEPKPTQRYEPKSEQGYEQRYEPKPTQRYEPKSEQGYEQRYEPKPTQRYEPKSGQGYEQRYEPKPTQRYEPKSEQRYEPSPAQSEGEEFGWQAEAGHTKKRMSTPVSAYANVFVCMFISVVLAVLALALPKPTYSEYERRDLAVMPEFSVAGFMSGKYNLDVESFFADTFPFRDSLVRLAAAVDEWKGLRLDDAKIHGTPPTQNSEPDPAPEIPEVKPSESSKPTQESSSSTSAPPVVDDGSVGEMVNSVFIYKNMAMELFGGSQAAGQTYANVLNDYRAKLPSSVKIYSVVVPTHVDFALPERYKNLSSSEKDNIDYIYSLLDKSITAVDAYSVLAQHTDEYIYFNTDHHWTGRGAYYAYTAFAKAAGLTPYEYDSYTKHKIEPFVGTLYGLTQDARLLKNTDYVEWCDIPVPHTAWRNLRYDPYTKYEIGGVMADYAKGVNAYSVYLHGDFPLTVASTKAGNGRKALIIKESYGNAFSTYLIPHFDETYIVDERYFLNNMVDFVKEKGVTDLIIINNCFAANTPYHINNISNLLYQPTPTMEQVKAWKEAAASASSSSEDAKEEENKKAGDEKVKNNEIKVVG